MQNIEQAFVDAVRRCKEIGFDFIEVHAAHGYLLHSFYSPLSNNRTDDYGGSLENRLRFPLQIIHRVRQEWSDKPLFVRISATDWAEGPERVDGEWKSWGIEQSKVFADKLADLDVDLIDTSSGGNWEHQKVQTGPGYQVPFAEALKAHLPPTSLTLIGTVGLITEPEQAESYLQDGKADVVLLARGFIRYPNWPFHAATKLGAAVRPPVQYERGWVHDMYKPKPAPAV